MPSLKNFAKYSEYARCFFLRKTATPMYFVFFITQNCNCLCKHCLLGKRKRVINELTLDEIEKISSTMGDILFFLVTGGEPFLRKDLPDIVGVFHKNNHIRNLGIPTNGLMTDRIVSYTEKILRTCPGLDVGIDISIDGIGEEHDKIRGVPGVFEKAKRTYKELEKLQKTYKNLNLNIGLTVSYFNQNKLDDILAYLSSELNVKTINYLVVRGKPSDSLSLDVKPEIYRKFGEKLEEFENRGILSGYKDFPYSDFVNSIRKVRRRVISDILETGKKQTQCFAARFGGVLQSNGEVLPCELLDKSMGNIRDYNYDFSKIWSGSKADEVRKLIRDTNCFCTYECFLTISVFFTPALFLPKNEESRLCQR